MNHPILGASHEVIEGQFVSTKIANLVTAIREYCEEINVHWIPPAAREEGQAAYRIVHYPAGQEPYIMFTVRRDEDMDERILQRIIQNDQRFSEVTLSEYDAWQEAQRRLKHQEFLDRIEEANDIAHHVLQSRLHKYKVNKNITIEDRGGII